MTMRKIPNDASLGRCLQRPISATISFLNVFIGFSYGKPMESIEKYNVILVHGAADSDSGIDCEKEKSILEADYYGRKDDNDTFSVYLQRPFVNPAGSADFHLHKR